VAATFPVSSLTLFQSRLSPQGAEHTPLMLIPLEAAPYVPRSRPRPARRPARGGRPALGRRPPAANGPGGRPSGPRNPETPGPAPAGPARAPDGAARTSPPIDAARPAVKTIPRGTASALAPAGPADPPSPPEDLTPAVPTVGPAHETDSAGPVPAEGPGTVPADARASDAQAQLDFGAGFPVPEDAEPQPQDSEPRPDDAEPRPEGPESRDPATVRTSAGAAPGTPKDKPAKAAAKRPGRFGKKRRRGPR
jgi:hypothetical protein